MDTNLTAATIALPAEPPVAAQPVKTDTSKPVANKDRVQTIDAIRGVALCGILLMNIPGFGLHWTEFYNVLKNPQNTADYYTFVNIEVFFSGTMRALFSMLFGAGMVLFTQHKMDTPSGATVAELYYRRLLLLVGFGLFNAFVLLWWGDILYGYGLAGMLLYPFRKTAAKWLLVLGIACIGIGIVKSHWNFLDAKKARLSYLEVVKVEKDGKKLTEEQESAKAEWQARENWMPDQDKVKREVTAVQGSYASGWQNYLSRNSNLQSWGLYHNLWDVLSMMFIGMGLFALGFFTNKLSTSTYAMCLLVGYGVGIPLSWVYVDKGLKASLNVASYVDTYRMTPEVLYDVRRVCLAIGHASLVMLFFRSRLVPWLIKGLANVGQMAFTNYLVQSIICTLIFHGYGLGYYNKLAFHQLYYIVAGVWIFQIIASAIWLRFFRFGPFEWAWRSLTYGSRQSMRKPGVQEAAV